MTSPLQEGLELDSSSSQPRAALVLLAAGSGSRVGHEVNKVFLPLAGRRVFTWSLRWASQIPEVCRIVLVVADRDRESAATVLAREVPGLDVELVVGGDTRHQSEWHALQALSDEIVRGDLDIVVIHDAARPLAGTPVFADVIAAAHEHGGALPVRPQPTLVTAQPGGTRPGSVVAVQTPQAFRATPLLDAYRTAFDEGFVGTDTASCIEKFTQLPVRCVPGPAANIKITFPEDLFLAEHLLAQAHWDLTRRQGDHE
jgi:2-C-methyl-D-erythritol 4-phosphate cytidylyltransferase